MVVLPATAATSSSNTSGTQPSTSNKNPNGNSKSAMDVALATLLPIRDLSRNWDVDIASCLEEYLQELAGLSLGADHPESSLPRGGDLTAAMAAAAAVDIAGGGTGFAPNFAHAALILQNSSHVYGRKVEYLHGLVYKALNEFFRTSNSSGPRGGGAPAARRKVTDPDVEDFYDFDPHEDFLLLDDVIPEDPTLERINLAGGDDDDADEVDGGRYGGGKSPHGDSVIHDRSYTSQRTRLSLGGLSTTGRSRLDRASLGGGGGRGSLASAQQQRALLATLNSGSLRLVDGHCDVGEDGVLLMPGSQPGNTESPMHGLGSADDDGGRRSLFSEEVGGGGSGSNLGTSTGQENVPDCDGDHSVGDDGPGFVMNDDDDDDVDKPRGTEEVDAVPQAAMQSQKRVTFDDPSTDPPKKETKKIDLWALMDPHSISDGYVPKPLRKGKTYRLPKGVSRPPSECVTGARTSHISHPQCRTMTFPSARPSLAVEFFRVAMGKQLSLTSKISCYGLAFGDEFIYIAKENARLRAAKARAERMQQRDGNNGRASSLRPGYHPTAAENGGSNREMNDDLDDDGGGGFDFGGRDDDFDDDYDGVGGGGAVSLGNAGVESFDDVFNREREGMTSESNMGKTFEELCRAHIAAFAKGAERFAMNNKLTERVNKWQARLAPILEEEERRAAFDIHYYSEVLLENSLAKVQRTKRKSDGSKQPTNSSIPVDFGSITQGCTQSDVCRFFLASLSLANAGNLEIEDGSDHYQFKVLSDDMKNPMETYRAPSLASI